MKHVRIQFHTFHVGNLENNANISVQFLDADKAWKLAVLLKFRKNIGNMAHFHVVPLSKNRSTLSTNRYESLNNLITAITNYSLLLPNYLLLKHYPAFL